jgi:hypothetical protein
MAFRLQKRHHKIGAGITLGIIAFIIIFSALVNHYWSPILAKKIHSIVLTSSDSLYRADFSDAELHVVRGQLVIFNLNITPDTAVYNRRKLQHTAPNNLFELHIKRLIIEHIHPLKLYFKRKLDIGNVILNNPEIKVSYQLNHKKDTVLKDRRTAWEKIKKTLHSIHVGGIYLNDVKLKYEDYSGNKLLISELKQMNLSATDLLIDSATQLDKSRVLYCKDIVAELNGYTGKTNDGLYAYKIKHLKLSTLTSQLSVEGFSLKATTSKFFSKTKNDRYTINVDSLQLNRFDYLGYHKYRSVHANMMSIHGGSFSLFNNPNRTQQASKNKLKSFPAVVLHNLSTDVELDTLHIRRFNVAYSEYNTKSKQSGTISFDNISGHLYNLTNNKEALAKNNVATVDLNSYFMNQGKLHVHFSFDLIAKNAAFSYQGALGPMDLEALNGATMPFAMVKITNGLLKSFSFAVQANGYSANGHVKLLYNDLKVKVLKPDSTYGFKGKLLESLYANIFIIKHDNPDNPGDAPREFNVHYIRPDSVTFFSSVWRTLLTGIKPSAGLDKKTEQATAEKMRQTQANKLDRQQRRALRRARRAEKKKEKELKKAEKKNERELEKEEKKR